MVFVFFWRISLSMRVSGSLHVAANGIMSLLYMAVYIYHIFLIWSSISGHLGCFHVLAIVNSAAKIMQVHVSFLRKFCLDRCPRVGFLGHMVVLCIDFYGTCILFSIVAVPACITTKSAGGWVKWTLKRLLRTARWGWMWLCGQDFLNFVPRFFLVLMFSGTSSMNVWQQSAQPEFNTILADLNIISH